MILVGVSPLAALDDVVPKSEKESIVSVRPVDRVVSIGSNDRGGASNI